MNMQCDVRHTSADIQMSYIDGDPFWVVSSKNSCILLEGVLNEKTSFNVDHQTIAQINCWRRIRRCFFDRMRNED